MDQIINATKWAVLISIGNDPIRRNLTDTRENIELLRGGDVDVDSRA
jgi:hypothetical protein